MQLKEFPYTYVDFKLTVKYKLKCTEAMVLSIISSSARNNLNSKGESKGCLFSNSYFSALIQESERTVIRIINKLIDLGFVHREIIQKDKYKSRKLFCSLDIDPVKKEELSSDNLSGLEEVSGDKMSGGYDKLSRVSGDKMSHYYSYNIYNNKYNNNPLTPLEGGTVSELPVSDLNPKKSRPPKPPKEEPQEIIWPKHLDNAECREAWKNWKEHLKKKRKSYTPELEQKWLNKDIWKTAEVFLHSVITCTDNRYAGLHLINLPNHKQRKLTPQEQAEKIIEQFRREGKIPDPKDVNAIEVNSTNNKFLLEGF